MPRRLTDHGAIVEAAMEIQAIVMDWEQGDDRENRAHPANTWLSDWDQTERTMIGQRVRQLARHICQRAEQKKQEPLDVRSA